MNKYFTKLEQDGELYTVPKTEHIITPNDDGYNTLYSIWQPSLPDPSVDINTLTKKQIQTIVRLGKAADYFKIHETQITCKKGTTTLTWDVLGIDVDTPTDTRFTHSVTLGLHHIQYTLAFSPRQAAWHFPNGLAAGTYNFTITYQPWYSDDLNKTFQFTIETAIPAGGQFYLANNYNATVVGANGRTYSGPTSTSVIETVTISEGSDGTSLGNLTSTIHDTTNTLQRCVLGSNNYKDSSIRQYLNSDEWTPKTLWDRPPTWSSGNWQHDIDEDFLSIIGPVSKTTQYNTLTDGGGSYVLNDKFFLLSNREVYGSSNASEGSPYPYYSDFSSLSAAGNGADSNRIKTNTSGTAQYWWTRSPSVSSASNAWFVFSSGQLNDNGAFNARGVAPACCII